MSFPMQTAVSMTLIINTVFTLYCPVYSMSAHRVIPNAKGHFYSATKFAVRALLEGMRNELREMNSQIRVAVRIYSMTAD